MIELGLRVSNRTGPQSSNYMSERREVKGPQRAAWPFPVRSSEKKGAREASKDGRPSHTFQT